MEIFGIILAIGVIGSIAIPAIICIVGILQDIFIYNDKK